jgi:periplasmic divalent cation tolerance protein
MADVVVLYTTWPDAQTAEAAGAAAVEARLAACANVSAPIRSIYRWQGRIERAPEVVMTLKTTSEAARALTAFLVARHPYELPCVLALPVAEAHSHAPFLAWVGTELY